MAGNIYANKSARTRPRTHTILQARMHVLPLSAKVWSVQANCSALRAAHALSDRFEGGGGSADARKGFRLALAGSTATTGYADSEGRERRRTGRAPDLAASPSAVSSQRFWRRPPLYLRTRMHILSSCAKVFSAQANRNY